VEWGRPVCRPALTTPSPRTTPPPPNPRGRSCLPVPTRSR
jgi:hypothetical protein